MHNLNPNEKQILDSFSFFNSRKISTDFLAKALNYSEQEFDFELDVLAANGLIKLVQVKDKSWIEIDSEILLKNTDEEKIFLTNELINNLNNVDLNLEHYKYIINFRNLLSINILNDKQVYINLLSRLAHFARHKLGNYDHELKLCKEILSIQLEDLRSNDVEALARAYFSLGSVYFRLAKYEKSIEFYSKAADAFQSPTPFGYDESLADTLNNLGMVYFSLGDLNSSIKFYEKSLEMNKNSLNRLNKQAIVKNLSNLGAVYNELGDYKKSIEFFENALDLNESKDSTGHILSNMSLVYLRLGETKKAIAYLSQSWAVLGESDDYELAGDVFNNLGLALNEMGDYKKAIEVFEMCLRIKKAFLPRNHPSIGDSLNNLGSSAQKCRQYTQSDTRNL